jgi:Ca2+-transporting ATPase
VSCSTPKSIPPLCTELLTLHSNRRLDNKFNVFQGIHRNYFFIVINAIMVGGQVTIIFIGGQPFSITRITGVQWAICLVLAALSLPMAVLIRLFPDAWFDRIVQVVGGPFVVAYLAVHRYTYRLVATFKGRWQRNNADKPSKSRLDLPVVMTCEENMEDRDVEMGR